jgi:PRTRC genetic system protein E
MQTNFFSTLASLNLDGNFRLNIQRQPDNKMIVSVLLVRDDIKDKSVKQIPALVLAGFTDDLDKGFFDSIGQPVQRQNTLLCNLSAHEKALDKTKKDNESKNTGTSSNASGKRRRFDDQMKKVTDLEKQQNYGQAIAQLPKEKEYPEYAAEITKKMQELKGKHGSLSLFGADEEPGSKNDVEKEDSNENDDEDDDNENLEDEDNNDNMDEDEENN